MATLTNYMTYVRDRLGVPASDTMFSDAQVTSAVNMALHALDEEHDWPWCQATAVITTSTSTLTMSVYATTWKRIASVTIPTSEKKLVAWPTEDLLTESVTSLAEPDRYGLWAEAIILRPVPDATYTYNVNYIKRETDLSAGSDQPLLPSQFDGAVIAYAAFLLATREGDTGSAAAHLATYKEWVVRMRDNVKRLSAPRRVSVRPNGWI